ncbi:MAG: hypothetical protein WAO83_11075 [Fuerstiella sp.]|jgi:hypothetical protein
MPRIFLLAAAVFAIVNAHAKADIDWFLTDSGTLFLDSNERGVDETITVHTFKGRIYASHLPSGTTTPLFDASEVTGLYITGDADDDTITNDTNLFCYMDGGDGDDTLIGGNGIDILFGNNGRDLLRGRGGDDTLNAGNDLDEVGMFGGPGFDLYMLPTFYMRFGNLLFNMSNYGITQEYDQGIAIWGNDTVQNRQVILN